ncbi:MAG: PAS domain-containing protein [Desulfoarculaceae bacterium]|nr:PAS domain-containing protein [Desulfoarculaceae bacterium]
MADTPLKPETAALDCPTGKGNELFDAIQDPVLIVTPEGVIIDANLAAINAAHKTKKQIIGMGICKIIHGGSSPHLKCPLETFLRTRAPRVEETRLPGLFGEYLLTISPVKDCDGIIRKTLLIARELTPDELRKVDSMRTAQLAAIGELAAGVAHEVNNPITGIINYAQLLLDDSEKDSLQAQLLTRIINEGERIASIIKNLLSFAREGNQENEPIDMIQVIGDTLSLVEHQFKKDGIKISTDFSQDPCPIYGNFRQLQQVILNLLSNSRFSLNERYPTTSPDKKVMIACHLVTAPSIPGSNSIRPSLAAPTEDEKSRIQISIRDQGTGIPQGILERIFDPFFTTKPAGQGTGLGLSISFGIIQAHGGTIKVNSIMHQFTEMLIHIPASGSHHAAE